RAGAPPSGPPKPGRPLRRRAGEARRYLPAPPPPGDPAALGGTMPVTGAVQATQLARIMARYGFEAAVGTTDRRSLIHRFGDGVLVLMLVWATNPCAIRSALLRCCNLRFFVSRAALERRYIASLRAGSPVSSGVA